MLVNADNMLLCGRAVSRALSGGQPSNEIFRKAMAHLVIDYAPGVWHCLPVVYCKGVVSCARGSKGIAGQSRSQPSSFNSLGNIIGRQVGKSTSQTMPCIERMSVVSSM